MGFIYTVVTETHDGMQQLLDLVFPFYIMCATYKKQKKTWKKSEDFVFKPNQNAFIIKTAL